MQYKHLRCTQLRTAQQRIAALRAVGSLNLTKIRHRSVTDWCLCTAPVMKATCADPYNVQMWTRVRAHIYCTLHLLVCVHNTHNHELPFCELQNTAPCIEPLVTKQPGITTS
jgi:hypothetical protein